MKNSKKWSIIALAVAILTPVAYFTSTGQMSGLGSSALTTTNVCTEKSQAKKLAEYNNAAKNRERTQSKLAIIYDQISALEKRITAQKLIIKQKEETISKQTKTITELDEYIKKNCTNPKTTQQKNLCNQKKQQKNSLTQNNLAQTSAIKTATSSIRQLEWQIESKKSEITSLNQKIEAYTAILLSYELCEAELGVKFYPACSLLFHTLGIDINTPCENESWKIFQGYPFGQAWVEYRFILKGSEVKDVSVQSLTFFLGGTDEQKAKFTNMRLSTGIETNDVIAQCEKVADSIHCPLSSPITLKKQDIAYWYLNANVDIAEDHSFTLDAGGVNVGGKYDTKNKNQNTKFAIIAYAKSPLTGEPGNFNVWETKKDHTIKLGSGSQTLYEFQVKAENGEVAMTDVVLSSEFLEGSGKIPEDFISCADPKLRNQLFDGVLELYNGTMLIATSEDYGQTYTKFDIKNPILIKPNTEKKFTVKAKMQSNGLGTQCSFSVTPNILANSGSFSTHELNYITTIKGTNTSQFRFSSWKCYNGEKQEQGGPSSCKSTDTWRKYAEDFCAQKCSPETGKCGVNSFSNSEPCGQTAVCGNGIVETGEQCDDNNLNSWDGCSQTCWIEWTYPWYFMKTDKQEYGNGDTILLSMSSVSGIKWFVDLYIQPNTWYGSEKGILIAKSIEVNPKTTYKIVIPDHAKIFDETDGYLLVISAAGQARRPDNVNSVPVRVSVPSTILCGNGIKEGTEQCDDGNKNNGDGCNSTCQQEIKDICTDTDGWMDYYKKGELLNNGIAYKNSVDYCQNDTLLFEYDCWTENGITGSGHKSFGGSAYSCPNGCSNGACKKVDLKPDISINITDANSNDIDKVVGNDTQTILSGGIANFKVRISNIGTEDVKNISVADSLVPGCNGVINLPNMYPTVWSNFTVGGNGNHSDSNLQPGEFIEFTCSQHNTVGSFINSITSNAQGATSSVVVTSNDSTAVVVKIPQPSELSVYPQLESAFSTPRSIIPVGTTGVSNGSKSTFLFQTDTGDAIDIHEVSFTIQGANTIKALKWEWKNITVPVINNTALFFIPESQSKIDSGSHLVFTVEYNGVGNLGVPYASTSKLILNSVKYTDATWSTKRKAYSAATDVVTLVGSVPHIFIDPVPNNTLMNGTINLGKMKIVAHPTGDVSLRTFAVVITKPSNISLTNFELHGPTGIIATETSTITNLPTKKIVEFVVTNPYTINAESMSIFDIRASVSGAISDQKIVWYLSSDFTWIDNTFGIDKIGANAGLFTWNLIDFPQNIIELSN